MNEKNCVRNVIRMSYALEMEQLGHKVLGTIPNNKDPNKLVWVFLNDETFDEDLQTIIERNRADDSRREEAQK